MALADAYKILQHGTLWSSTGKCKGYAVANPNEAKQVDAYVAALNTALLTGGAHPAPPALATDTGNGIVEMLAAAAGTAAPPPPPPSRRAGNGLLLNAQANSFYTLTPEQHKVFGGIISGSDKAAALTALGAPVTGFLYHTVFETGASIVWPGGVTQAQAVANGWTYNDAHGVPIQNIANPGIAGYQQAWTTNVLPQVAVCPALFLDNTDGNIWWGQAPVVNGVTQTDADVANAMISFFTHLRATFPNVYIFANVSQGSPDRIAWLKRLLPLINGAMCEDFDGGTVSQQFAAACKAANRDFWALGPYSVTDPKSAAARDMATKFASMWDRQGGGFGWQDGSWAADPNWTSVITG